MYVFERVAKANELHISDLSNFFFVFLVHCKFKFSFRMEYEVYLACNLIGTMVVVLIFVYHLVASKPIVSLSTALNDDEVLLSLKKKNN